MAYQAMIVPVMIASPGDVLDERRVVRETIHEWNDVNSVSSKVMLAPVGWDSHSSPELGARPQEIINKRVLAECDLLIGVFWTRVGTHTGVAASGTVEEIQEHTAAGKPAMIYFSTQPVSPDALDQGQYQQLRDFKAWCKQQGLIQEFANIQEFRAMLWKHLSITIHKNPYLRSLLTNEGALSSEGLSYPVLQYMVSKSEAQVRPPFDLGKEASDLLKAAASKDGYIHKLNFLSGKHFQAGSEQFGSEGPRDFARYEGGLNALLERQLVTARGYKDELFELTNLGWQAADALG